MPTDAPIRIKGMNASKSTGTKTGNSTAEGSPIALNHRGGDRTADVMAMLPHEDPGEFGCWNRRSRRASG